MGRTDGPGGRSSERPSVGTSDVADGENPMAAVMGLIAATLRAADNTIDEGRRPWPKVPAERGLTCTLEDRGRHASRAG